MKLVDKLLIINLVVFCVIYAETQQMFFLVATIGTGIALLLPSK